MKQIKISTLVALDYNPRIITEDEMERLKTSIREHTNAFPLEERNGYRLATSITVNRQGNRIVGGHQRVKALEALGQDWVHENDITWINVEPNSAKEKTLNIALNSKDASGKYDLEKLSNLLFELKEANIDINDTVLAPDLIEDLTLEDWTPPDAVDGMLDQFQIEKPKPLIVDKEDYPTVRNAISRVRKVKQDGTLSDGICVSVICEEVP